MIPVDWLVVGAGFTGATFAERMASAGKKVLVVDSRLHIGGNAYDECNEHDILVHKYGPHIFHTNSARVWSYLSQFTMWRPYQHHVQGLVDGKLVPIPFNLNSLAALFPVRLAARIETQLIATYGYGAKVPILKLRESNQTEIRLLADYVYDHVFRGYTLKQWGLHPDELRPSVTARVPVHISRDDRYFQDTFQGMPAQGYTAMFRRMLSHSGIKLLLNCNWSDICRDVAAERIFFSGPLDDLLDYRFGPLPYRSLRFEQHTYPQEQVQAVGTVNYPNDNDFTRITEQKILTGQHGRSTTLVTEYPIAHDPGHTIAYYPIPQKINEEAHGRYERAARAEYPNMVFAGRLADYQYYNMDQACARSLALAADHGG